MFDLVLLSILLLAGLWPRRYRDMRAEMKSDTTHEGLELIGE